MSNLNYSATDFEIITPSPQEKTSVMSSTDYQLLKDMYQKSLYPAITLISTTQFYTSYSRMICFGEKLRHGTTVMASWQCRDHVCCTSCSDTLSIGVIEYLISHTAVFLVDGTQKL